MVSLGFSDQRVRDSHVNADACFFGVGAAGDLQASNILLVDADGSEAHGDDERSFNAKVGFNAPCQ